MKENNTNRKLHSFICSSCGNIVQSYEVSRTGKCVRCQVAERRRRKSKRPEEVGIKPSAAYLKFKRQADLKQKSFNEILSDIERYNKEHGTNLSYGQYMALFR